ncbi:MAG: LysE family translocator [Chloroflexi bacterium]|nr:LysE family translocator [Chloroflexota bacterium]
MSAEFLLTTFIIVATPGTGVLYTLSAGLSHGTRVSAIAALACTLGIVPHVLVAISGLATVLSASAPAFEAIKYLGVGYLLYLAWTTWTDRRTLTVEQSHTRPAAGRIILSGILINVLNPKLTIFFFAFLPQFVTASHPDAVSRMLGLSAVFMLMTLVVFAAYGAFAARVRRHVIGRPTVMRWIRRTFAATFLALGVRLALAER